jgi:hypothetical protein
VGDHGRGHENGRSFSGGAEGEDEGHVEEEARLKSSEDGWCFQKAATGSGFAAAQCTMMSI